MREEDRYQMIFDYHTHTTYSHGIVKWRPHGRGTVMENAKGASDRGLLELAITDHGPGHLTYGIRLPQLPQIREEISEAKKAYPHLKIHLGVEANILMGEHSLDILPWEAGRFDFLIGGYHLAVGNANARANFKVGRGIPMARSEKEGLTRKNTDMIVRALYENHLKILTHPGDKAPVFMDEIARACAKTHTWMEISNFHSHLTVEEIKLCAREDVSFVISSDAHHPSRVGNYKEGLARALEAKLDPARILNLRKTQ